jgi:hypothetical protein
MARKIIATKGAQYTQMPQKKLHSGPKKRAIEQNLVQK